MNDLFSTHRSVIRKWVILLISCRRSNQEVYNFPVLQIPLVHGSIGIPFSSRSIIIVMLKISLVIDKGKTLTIDKKKKIAIFNDFSYQSYHPIMT